MHQTEINYIYESRKKSLFVAYVCWLFGGAFGGSYVYVGEVKAVAVMLIMALLSLVSSAFTLLWLYCAIISLFDINRAVRDKNYEIMREIKSQ